MPMSSFETAPRALGLDHHLPDLAVQVEVIDVVTAQVGLEHGEHVRDRDAQPLGLDAIELEPDLGHVHRKRREEAAELGLLSRLLEKPIGDQRQRLDALAVAVLDHEFEAAGLAQAADRRRLKHDRDGAAHSCEIAAWSLPVNAGARSSVAVRSLHSLRSQTRSPSWSDWWSSRR